MKRTAFIYSAISILLLLFPLQMFAKVSVQVKVLALDGTPLSNIVVSADPSGETKSNKSSAPLKATMQQINQQFVPHILAINKGTLVEFPNTDTVKHHVYSFSPAKTFEISIQAKLSKTGVLFDQAGIVELGCNIHDWMLGYIYVADTEIYGTTDQDGIFASSMENAGYTLNIWHPRLNNKEILQEHSIDVDSTKNDTFFTIQLSTDLLPSFSEFDKVGGLDNYD
ncbi:methylamine utilization protein [Glaciecola petra]|uniref:Methylamine utilization protein n=1 Tax=Glaciecola petra TaxID=3075602 RepID=A0ABU2ZTR7_9ALTE|nr:methylamine utilization protein [Aestuariibacter sp. P117]MDT0596026.1 methylamine utilization protein [Aestuariibacter sp. P117]